MKRFDLTIYAVTLLLTVARANADTVDANMEEAALYFPNANFSAESLSPDGAYLGLRFAGDVFASPSLVVFETENMTTQLRKGELTMLFKDGITWIDDQRVVAGTPMSVFDTSRDKVRRLYSGPGTRKKTQTRRLLHRISTSIVDPLLTDPDHVLVSSIDESAIKDLLAIDDDDADAQAQVERLSGRLRLNVYRKSVRKKNKMTLVYANPGDEYRWLVDKQGRVLIAFASTAEGLMEIRARRDETASWEVVDRPDMITNFMIPVAFTDDTNVIYVLSNHERSTIGLFRYDLTERQHLDLVYAHDEYDLAEVLFDQDGGNIIGATYMDDVLRFQFFDERRQSLYRKLVDAFPDHSLDVRFSRDINKASVTAYSDVEPGRLYLFDTATLNAEEVMASQKINPRVKLSSVEHVRIPLSDGLKLRGLLARPQHTESNGAMLLRVASDPFGTQRLWEYDPDVQFLVRRGYTVLTVLLRGAFGYGREYETSGWGELHSTIQNDIREVALWAKKEGAYEDDRVCIYGEGYGGYSVMMSVGLFPDLFRCGISYGGISDLAQMAEYTVDNLSGLSANTFITAYMGDMDLIDLREASPIAHATDIKAPLMLFHGKNDRNVPAEQTTQFADALRALDKSVSEHVYNGPERDRTSDRGKVTILVGIELFLEQHTLLRDAEDAQ